MDRERATHKGAAGADEADVSEDLCCSSRGNVWEEVKWCGKLYSGSNMQYNSEIGQRFTDLTTPLTAGKLQHFLVR